MAAFRPSGKISKLGESQRKIVSPRPPARHRAPYRILHTPCDVNLFGSLLPHADWCLQSDVVHLSSSGHGHREGWPGQRSVYPIWGELAGRRWGWDEPPRRHVSRRLLWAVAWHSRVSKSSPPFSLQAASTLTHHHALNPPVKFAKWCTRARWSSLRGPAGHVKPIRQP